MIVCVCVCVCVCSVEEVCRVSVFYLPCRQRIPSKNVFYYRSPEHSKNYVLTIAFAFDKEKDVYHFAYCYPYSYSRLQGYLSKLDQMSAACYKKELLAFSVVCWRA